MELPLDAMTRLKVLVLSDLDGQILRVNRLCDRIVCSADGDVTAVIVSGGLVAPCNPRAYDTLEEVAAAEGDMMALVARLETIVCRVLYIPDDVRCTQFCASLASGRRRLTRVSALGRATRRPHAASSCRHQR